MKRLPAASSGGPVRDRLLPVPEFVFTSFLRENRPLSAELWRRARPLMSRIATATSVEDLDAFQTTLVGKAVAELGIQSPRLGRVRNASDREGETKWDAARTAGSPTRSFYVALEVLGDITLTLCWPDLAGADLEPVDAGVVAELGGLDAIARASAEDAGRYLRAGQVWEIGADADPRDGQPAVFSPYTHFELTLEDEEAVARGDLDLARMVRERREHITPIIAAIAEQVQIFLTSDLPDRLMAMAEAKRMEVSNRQAVRDSLSFPEDWLGREPELDDAPLDALPAAQDEREPRSAEPEGIHLNPRSRLSRATFEDVLFSMRHWANAVERYPAAFGALVEDRISDLLAATWNATLPGAGREVYSRGGKSDIFIQADVLDPGRGPATVFICEAKWATSHDVIREAVDPQLFGYLNVHDTAAVLLVLMRQKDFSAACATYLEVLESVAGHEKTEIGPVTGWPLLKFNQDSRTVTLCAAFVHLSVGGPGNGD
jgi:hypothetical protein